MPPKRNDDPVVLSRIYTRTGDDGSTALADGSRAPKTDSRLAAYADVEEANCAIGVAVALGQPGPELVALLSRVQNEFSGAGAPRPTRTSETPPYPPLRIDGSYIERLEQ